MPEGLRQPTTPSALTPWTAKSWTEYALAALPATPLHTGARHHLEPARQRRHGLDYTPARIETAGRRLLDVLAELWPQAQGLSFRVTAINYAGSQVTIRPFAVLADGTPLDLDNGAYSNRRIKLRRQVPAAAVMGGPSRCVVSLVWDKAGSANSLTPLFDASTAADDLAVHSDGEQQNTSGTWRQWQLAEDWDGSTYDNANDGITTASAADGSRSFGTQAGAALFATYAARFDRGRLINTANFAQPLAIAYDTGTDEAEDLSKFGITFDDDKKTVSIGSTINDGLDLATALSNRILIVSLAITEPDPLAAWTDAPPGRRISPKPSLSSTPTCTASASPTAL